MNLERLTARAIRARQLDRATVQKIRHLMDRSPHLTAEEYEALRHLGRAVASGEVRMLDTAPAAP